MDYELILEKLDNVLKYLNGLSEPIYQNITDITEALHTTLSTNESELLLLIEKLIEDRYVSVENREVTHWATAYISSVRDERYYAITANGRMFLYISGYTKQAAKQNAENIRLIKLENEAKGDRLLTSRLTILIAMGTLVAGTYYLIEIYKEVHLFFHHIGRYWIWE